MFFQRDYILRMIEMMGDLMRRIRELMNDLMRMRMLNDSCIRHTGISLETAENLTVESLFDLLQPIPRLMMSEILYARAEAIAVQAEERETLFIKSVSLLASLWEESLLCELRADRLLEMKAVIGHRLKAAALLDCARFLMEADRFADMEDALFQAEERLLDDEGRKELRDTGFVMLEAAATAKPEVLALARSSRDELLESAREWRQLFA